VLIGASEKRAATEISDEFCELKKKLLSSRAPMIRVEHSSPLTDVDGWLHRYEHTTDNPDK